MSKIMELADNYARETHPRLITEARAALAAEVEMLEADVDAKADIAHRALDERDALRAKLATAARQSQRIAELEQKNAQLLEALTELYEGCIGFMSEDNSDMTKARAAIEAAEVKP